MSRTARIGTALLAVSLAACAGKDGAAGANGHSTLVLVVSEPAGAHCAQGGVAIEQGEDTNGNGILDPTEVDAAATVYVCNGAMGAMGDAGTGAPGAAGMTALVKLTPEPAGSNCEYGGERIDSGIDSNGDGTLETSEITSTSYVCNGNSFNGYHFGDIYLSQPSDFAQLTGVTHLVGNLIIEDTIGIDYAVSVPGLVAVDGTIGLNGDINDDRHNGGAVGRGIASISFPDLTSATELLLGGQTDLTTLSFPKLTSAGIIDIYEAEALTSVDFSSLTQSGGYIEFANTGLTSLALPNLVYASSFSLYSDDALVTASLPKLAAVVYLYIQYDDALATLSLPALTEATSQIYIQYCNALTTASMPLVTRSPSIYVDNNPLLSELDLPNLTSTAYLGLDNDPSYPRCDALKLAAQITPAPGTNFSGENSGGGYCTAGPQPTLISVAGISDPIYFGSVSYDFDDAEAGCETLGAGAHLLWFESAAELTAMQTAIANAVLPADSWIGYTDASDAALGITTTEGNWAVVSGYSSYNPAMPIGNTAFWAPGEPNGRTAENCAQLYTSNGFVNDYACTNEIAFLCRVPAVAASRAR